VEEWLPVVDYENYYEVSSYGRVRNAVTQKHVGSLDKYGYMKVTLRTPGSKRDYRIHRLVLEAFHGKPDVSRQLGLHRDGNKLNNREDNLYWGTQQENMQDAIEHGTHVSVAKTRCPQGHWYNEINTRITPEGYRVCKSCHRQREYARRQEERRTAKWSRS
jgi:hypothetical protein